MKRTHLTILIILFAFVCQAQKSFPYNVILKDINNKAISSKVIYNIDKPVIIEFWATHCAPCISLLNSYKEVYKQWQNEYGVKIIAISIDRKVSRKKALKLIKDNEWPFHFYFDHNKELFKKMTGFNAIPYTFVYDGNFNIYGKFKGIKPNFGYRIIDGEISDKIRVNLDSKFAHLDCDLTQYEDALELIKQNN